MNSQRSHFSPIRSIRRAQFSPLLRRATVDATFAQRDVAARLRHSPSVAGSFSDDSFTPTIAATAPRWWDPHLIDRLQSPLTRYHD